ncbi:MAG: hypothetical protein PHI91_00145 [Candidatus Pacebacteria bacterium]|nr:hypothetical protein [Candidatus Paceibacterota bacterium]MDD2757039.1 hypothetical protein [Candidatus Paceibacterota bacterium]MDD3283548.1 hypothetical protein [Candidatus Paceibacterota bacterium]MDD3969595.1 hypothetical protein [Candidatus Paceibacterota bacterium]MDD4737859.1 hypothetical protein [Candidatus Paceibacterota bacterium]
MKKLITFLLCVVLLIVIFVKVDSSEKENIDFIKTGNVVINNPGTEEDVWYLVYDEPGSPAKSVKLFFEEVPNINIGDRVTVEGTIEGEKVIVKRIVDKSIDL